MKPRPYQIEAIEGIREAFNSSNSVLAVLATGLGKTIIASMLSKEMLPFGKTLFLAHREELIYQAARKLYTVTGVEPAIEMGFDHVTDQHEYQPDIIVSTIQTQISGMGGNGRMTKFDPDRFSLLIVDEAHHVCASSHRRVIDYYQQNSNLKVLGVTATPDRADEKALGEIFDTVAYEYGIREAIEDGWLVPIEQRAVFVKGIDLSQVRTTAGDLNGADLAEVMEEEQNLHEVASPTLELTGDKKTLVFAASVRQAERLTEILNRHKENCARFVYAKTDKEVRREMLKDYRDGKFQYLVNVGITTEGFDEPSIEVIVMARPTKSRSLFAQMSGRGTRALTGVLDDLETAEERKEAIAYSGKPKLEIIDFVGNSGRHKLVSTADILGGKYSDEVVKRAKENIEKSDKSEDVLIELDKAEQQLLAEKRRKEEAARRANLKLKAQYKTTKINPFDVLDIIPARERAWHRGRLPSQKQTDLLEKFGVNPEGLSFTSASQLIGKILQRRKSDLCSFRQAALLQRYGYDTSTITFKAAGEIITNLKVNGWRRLGE